MDFKLQAKIKHALRDGDVREIFHGSVLTLVAKIVAVLLGFLLSIIISRFYGAEAMGVFALMNTFFAIAMVLGLMGMNVSVLRFIPSYTATHSKAAAYTVYKKSALLVMVSSLIVTAGAWAVSGTIAREVLDKPGMAELFFFGTFFILFKAVTLLNVSVVRALKALRAYNAFQIATPLVSIGILLLLGLAAYDIANPVYMLFLSGVIMFAASTVVVIKLFGSSRTEVSSASDLAYATLLKTSLPMLLTSVTSVILTQTDIVMIGIYLSTEDVGVYAVSIKLALLVSFVLGAINTIVAPRFAELHARGEHERLEHVVSASSKMIFFSVLPIVAGLIILGKPLLSLFGMHFTVGYGVLVILAIGQLFNAIAGSVGYLMNMSGHEKAYNLIMIASVVVNIALNILLIPQYGITGAAIASAVSMVVGNAAAVWYVKSRFGFYCGYIPGGAWVHE